MKDIITPEQALERLKKGNERFVKESFKNKNYGEQREITAGGQSPHSVVMSCIDSRSAAEQFFDTTIGEIFNVRLAGNVIDDYAIGSIEFATKVAGSSLVAVIGHSNCGAVQGAIDKVRMGHLSGLLEDIEPAMNQVPDSIEPRTTNNADFVHEVTRQHIKNVVEAIPKKSDIIRELAEAGTIKIVGGLHDLPSGKVTFFE